MEARPKNASLENVELILDSNAIQNRHPTNPNKQMFKTSA